METCPLKPSVSIGTRLWVLLQKLLGLIDLRSEVRRAAAIGVVEEHQRAVGLADFVFV